VALTPLHTDTTAPRQPQTKLASLKAITDAILKAPVELTAEQVAWLVLKELSPLTPTRTPKEFTHAQGPRRPTPPLG